MLVWLLGGSSTGKSSIARRMLAIDPDVRVDTTHRTAAECAQEIVGLVRSRAAAQPLT